MTTPADGQPAQDRPGGDHAAATPAADLADVWVLLDELPRGSASAVMTATTIEMAAVAAAAGRGGRSSWSVVDSSWRRWIAPLLTVVAALVAGVVAGRISSTDADERLFEELPLVMHLDLLREAGSERFLEELVKLNAQAPPRLALRLGIDTARKKAEAVVDEIKDLAKMLAPAESAAARTRQRRELVAGLPLEERIELEKSARAFVKLSANERRGLAAVAAALVDPQRPQLRAAAVVWHQWLSAVRPEDRDDIIASSTDKRLEWVEWYAQRLGPGGAGGPGGQGAPPGGGFDRRDWERRPRPQLPGGPQPPPEGDPRGRGPGMRPRDGEPEPPPRPFNPERRPPPPETPAPPR